MYRVPLVVAYGGGVDSSAMLILMARRGIRPDLILMADTGGEKPQTYEYVNTTFRDWLRAVQFPPVVWVRRGKGKKVPYMTLEGQCLYHGTLPSIAFRRNKTCSIKWKREPQDRYVVSWPPATRCWEQGKRVLKAIGFDAGPSDGRRIKDSTTCGECGHKWTPERGGLLQLECPVCQEKVEELYDYWYPLAEWGYDREACKEVIRSEGLAVPIKSACFFCPSAKKHEIQWLSENHPDLLRRSLQMEERAWPKLRGIKGLGGHDYSWTGYTQLMNCQREWIHLLEKPRKKPLLMATEEDCASCGR